MVSLERQIALSKTEQVAAANTLNAYFEAGGSVYHPNILSLIRDLPYPFIFDANGTIINDGKPHWEANPESYEALSIANEVGSIVIVTRAKDWTKRKEVLEELGLWRADMVMLNPRNYIPDSNHQHLAEWAIDNYIQKSWSLGQNIQTTASRINDRESKHVSHILAKSFYPVIIDNSPLATVNNPGMNGLQVRTYLTGGYTDEPQFPTLLEATMKAKEYYVQLQKQGM